MKRRKTPWGFWTAVLLLLVFVVYPLSIGPQELVYVGLLRYGDGVLDWYLACYWIVYGPLEWLMESGPEWIANPLRAYQEWWYNLALGGPVL